MFYPPRPSQLPEWRVVSQMVSHGQDESGEILLSVAARSVGLRRAMRALTFMAAWDRARKAMRKEALTLDEYREWWRESERTSFRDQQRFREAFPGESTPDRLLDLAEGQWVERNGISGLGRIRVS
jgi:hypothetical protein